MGTNSRFYHSKCTVTRKTFPKTAVDRHSVNRHSKPPIKGEWINAEFQKDHSMKSKKSVYPENLPRLKLEKIF